MNLRQSASILGNNEPENARGEGTVTTVGVRCTVYDAVEVAIAISVQAELRVSAST